MTVGVLKKNWIYIPAAILAVTTIFPLVWIFAESLKDPAEAANLLGPIFPSHPTLSNFIEVFRTTPFWRYIVNTFIYAGVVTIFALLVAAMAGYALARLEFPGKKIIFTTILSTMMIPFSVIMIPLFLIVKSFGWVDSLWGLIIPALFGGFSTFLVRQFFMGLPKELEEAGKIDGLSIFGIFIKIALPLSKPILYALAVFIFLANWNNYLWPLILLQSPSHWVISLGIGSFSTEHNTAWNMIAAGSIISIIPTVALFALFQKQLVEGIKMTGVK